MSDTWGALAQASPGALTDIYTVPAAKRGTVEVIMCNVGAAALVSLSQAPAGAADNAIQYLLYEAAIDTGETKTTARFTVTGGDVIRGFSDTGDVSFNVNGIEEDS